MKHQRSVGLGLCMAVWLFGCAAPAQPQATAPVQPSPAVLPAASPLQQAAAAASPQPLTHVTVSYSNLVMDHLPLWIAQDTGIFQAHGLDVDMEYIQSTQGMSALLAGQVNIFQGGGAEALSSIANGADLEVVANVLPVYPFVFAVAPSIQSADDLKGKAVGVAGPGGAQDVATRVELQKQGLNPDTDVTIIYTGAAANVVGAMQNGAMQGALQNPLEMSDLQALGFHSLFGTASLNLPAPQNVTVVQRSYAAANRDVLQRYVDAMIEGIAREKQDRALSVQETEKYLSSTDEEKISAAYDYYTQWVPSYPLLNPDQFADSVTQLSANDPRVGEINLSNVLDNSFVQSAQERQGS